MIYAGQVDSLLSRFLPSPRCGWSSRPPKRGFGKYNRWVGVVKAGVGEIYKK